MAYLKHLQGEDLDRTPRKTAARDAHWGKDHGASFSTESQGVQPPRNTLTLAWEVGWVPALPISLLGTKAQGCWVDW